MAVKKLENGKWLSKINFRNKDGVITTKEKRFETKREALDFETDYRRQLKEGIGESSVRYKEILSLYLLKNNIKANPDTIKEKKYLSEKFWGILFEKKYTNISRKDWLDVYIKICNSDMSVSRKNKTITILKSVCKFAYTYHDLPDNSKTLELLPKEKNTEYNVWNINQFNKFSNEVTMVDKRIFFETLYFTGCRRDEIRLLRKIDFNHIRKEIYIREYEGRSLKNKASIRTIKITEDLSDKLADLLDIEGPYLFGGLKPYSKNAIAHHFNRATKLAKLPKIRLHDLRHSHATLLINGGASIVSVSKRLGHTNITQTLDTYTHLVDKEEEKILEIISA